MARAPNLHLNPVNGAWALGFCLLISGTAAGLRAFGVAWSIILAWVLVSGAIFVMLEPGLIASLWELVLPEKRKAKPIKKPPDEKPLPSGSDTAKPDDSSGKKSDDDSEKYESPVSPEAESKWWIEESERFRNTIRRRLLETSLAIVLAALAFVASRTLQGTPTPPRGGDGQRVIDELGSALKQCLDHTCNTAEAAGSGGGSIRLDPELERALIEHLRHANSQPLDSRSSFSWGGVTALVILVVAAGAAAVVLVVRKRPATAAPLGAAGLALAAIKNADHLSHLDPGRWSFWPVVILFAGVIAMLIVVCFKQLNNGSPVDDDRGPKEGSRTVESPLNALFSIAVLLWAILVVCYRAESKGTPQPVKQSLGVTYKLLTPISGFGQYSMAIPGRDVPLIDPVKLLIREASSNGITTGDVLLLLGSADCTAIRKGHATKNKDLAQGRADAVVNALLNEKFFEAHSIRGESLYQHEGCFESADLRAVFPVLLQPRR